MIVNSIILIHLISSFLFLSLSLILIIMSFKMASYVTVCIYYPWWWFLRLWHRLRIGPSRTLETILQGKKPYEVTNPRWPLTLRASLTISILWAELILILKLAIFQPPPCRASQCKASTAKRDREADASKNIALVVSFNNSYSDVEGHLNQPPILKRGEKWPWKPPQQTENSRGRGSDGFWVVVGAWHRPTNCY